MKNKTTILNERIKELENTIWQLKEQEKDTILKDWKEKEGKYFLVESFSVQGKTYVYLYHVISIKQKELIYKYANLENGYTATHKLNSFGEPGYKSWTEISKKEFQNKIKGLEDLDKLTEGDKE